MMGRGKGGLGRRRRRGGPGARLCMPIRWGGEREVSFYVFEAGWWVSENVQHGGLDDAEDGEGNHGEAALRHFVYLIQFEITSN